MCPLAPWRHKGGTDASPSFGLNLEGPGHVYCFACQFGGSLGRLVMELRTLGADNLRLGEAMEFAIAADKEQPLELALDFEAAYLEGPTPVEPFPEWFREMFPPAYWQGTQHPYLGMRGVSQQFTEWADLRIDEHRQRVVFPVRDYEGTLAQLHGRSYAGASPPYHAYPYEGKTNRHVWLGEHSIDRDLPVLMVESVFDFAAVWGVYQNVLSPLSAAISREALFRITWIHEVALLFDPDDAGDKARTRVRRALPDARIIDLECPDDNDPGELDDETIAEILYPVFEEYLK